MSDDEALLYLYSSNIRPLYEQDILDLLAAPPGVSYQFRYESRYINDTAQREWTNLAGKTALIHFSLQQEAEFHESIFIPVRLATVRRGFRLGAIHVVELILGDYVALPAPSDDQGRRGLAKPVREYTDYLAARGVPRPYDVSAGLADSILGRSDVPLDRSDDKHLLFSRTCRYLQRTQSFRNARFYRFLSLTEKSSESNDRTVDETGVFVIDGGKSYELALVHDQPVDVSRPEKFSIAVDGSIIRLIGKHDFEIASRYDIVTIPFYAVESSIHETRDTLLVIEPQPAEQGPQLRMPIRVRSSLVRTAGAMGGSVAGLILLGVPSLFPDLDSFVKVLFVLVGGVTTAFLATFGLRRG